MILLSHLSVQIVYNSVINFVVFLMHCTNNYYDLMILHMQLQMKNKNDIWHALTLISGILVFSSAQENYSCSLSIKP